MSMAPFQRGKSTVRQQMNQVLLALVPGLVVYVWFFGWGIVVHMLLAVCTAMAAESAVMKLRKRPLKPALQDGSAVVTAVLLAFAIPPLAPWWVTVVGTLFAIVIAKQLYGGIGFNPFNPAMAGYVALLIAVPRELTTWPAVIELSGQYLWLFDSVSIIFSGELPGLALDAVTGATPLDLMKTSLSANASMDEVLRSPVFGDFGGRGWEWVANAFFIGGLWLIYQKVITWRIPLAVLGGIIASSLFFYAMDPGAYPSPMFHVFSGGTMLAAFFIATDPVSASTTPRGRVIYGIGIGVLTYVIRTWGGYPDGVAFSVLLMNMLAPTIDHYTRPRVVGHSKGRKVFHNSGDEGP